MRNPTHAKLMDEIKELHDRKNSDYAQKGNPYSNFERAALLAAMFKDPIDQVFATLIGVKLARLGQLLSSEKQLPKNESIEDSFKDLTNYCGIWTARYLDQSYHYQNYDYQKSLEQAQSVFTVPVDETGDHSLGTDEDEADNHSLGIVDEDHRP